LCVHDQNEPTIHCLRRGHAPCTLVIIHAATLKLASKLLSITLASLNQFLSRVSEWHCGDTRYWYSKYVRPSVCPSVRYVPVKTA